MRKCTLVALVALVATAHPLAGQDREDRKPRREDVAVQVRNDRRVPVTVFLRQPFFDRRLGEVPARGSEMIPIPRDAARDGERIRLVVHAEGDVDDLGTKAYRVEGPAVLSLLVPEHGLFSPAPEDTMTVTLPDAELMVATLTVENPRREPVTVYADLGEDFDVRLGRVPGHGTATLRIPKTVVRAGDRVRIFVDPDGGEDLRSEEMRIRKGEHLGLRVPKR